MHINEFRIIKTENLNIDINLKRSSWRAKNDKILLCTTKIGMVILTLKPMVDIYSYNLELKH